MKRTLSIVVIGLAASVSGGCKKKTATTEPAKGSAAEPTSATGSGSAAEGSAGAGSAEGSGSAAAAAPSAITVEGLSTPESALFDEAGDRYLVSNINGQPLGADDNGFISAVTPTGEATKWIDGAKPDIKLDAPKGMAFSGDMLWVADISVVRRFDLKTGAQKDDVKIKGATFLNDVVSDGAGGVYVSDSGLDASFKPTGSDAIYQIDKAGKVTQRIKDKGLGAPNGLASADGKLWAVTFGTGELFEVDAKGAKQNPSKLPKGQLDGIVVMDGGELLVSSWDAKAVFRGTPGGEWKEVVSGVESPADIGWDAGRKRVLVPLFTQNKLVIQPL
ncbi:MAG: SMP-30/gluconolactonase/LRE family protein [Kofleriaceae bacterium]